MTSSGGRAPRAPGTLSRAYAVLLDGFGLLAGIAFAAVAVLVTVNVILRNLGITNFPWLLEVSEYVLYGGTFLAAPWVLRLGAHVRVDLLPGLLPERPARVVNAAADTCGLVFSLVLARHGLNVTYDAFMRGDMMFKEIVIPEWPLLAVIPLCAAMLAIEFARRLFAGAATDDRRDDSPAPSDGL